MRSTARRKTDTLIAVTKVVNTRLFFFFFQEEDGIRDKLVTGVQTCALPISTIHALRKQPNRNSPTAPPPAASTRKSNAHQASTASSVNSRLPRTMPTTQEPTVRWRMPMGARNWGLMDFDQTSIRTA